MVLREYTIISPLPQITQRVLQQLSKPIIKNTPFHHHDQSQHLN